MFFYCKTRRNYLMILPSLVVSSFRRLVRMLRFQLHGDSINHKTAIAVNIGLVAKVEEYKCALELRIVCRRVGTTSPSMSFRRIFSPEHGAPTIQ